MVKEHHEATPATKKKGTDSRQSTSNQGNIMEKIIVGVATPIYSSTSSRKDLIPVNRQAKDALLTRFPGAQIVYDGLSDGAKAPPRIRFYAKLPATDPVAEALLAANEGRRPTVGRAFKGAVLIDVGAEGVVSTAVAGLTAEELSTKTLKELQAIGLTHGIKIANGTAKAKAIGMLAGTNVVRPAPSAPAPDVTPEAPAEVPSVEAAAEVVTEESSTVAE